jgi:uncharacterized protein
MSFSRTVAHFVTHRQRAVYTGIAIAVVVSAVLLAGFLRFNSDVLDLLPQKFDAVRSFKIFDREFTQAHEITFALWDEKHETDLDGFAEHFADELKKEPWIVRALASSPMESPDAMAEGQALAAPLLLNLDPPDFENALALLQPDKIQARLHRFRTEIEAGSPRAEMQLDFDPTGLVVEAFKPMRGSFSIEQTQPLASPDGTLRVVLAVTTQKDLGPHACQAMMAQIEDFERRVVASWDDKAPRILATGRTPYVSEMSRSMRFDIVSTLLGSVVLVAAVFYIGFRRFRPLLAIMHVLLLCCVMSVALGGVILRELNMITIGFCSILIGLGVDFGMLLYGSYQTHRNAGEDHEGAVEAAVRQLGRGIFFGAITTAAAFACLALSECAAFAQLGVLIAIGISLAGLFMMTVFFVFVGARHVPSEHDWFFYATQRYVRSVFKTPRRVLSATALLLAGLSVLAVAPVGKLNIESNPKTLEPHDSKAGFALRKIQEKMPGARIEPVLVIVESSDPQEFHDRWELLQKHWNGLVEHGDIKGFNAPGVFALSPRRLKTNAAKLASVDFAAARDALAKAVEQEGFSAESFKSGFALIDRLSAAAKGNIPGTDWRKTMPEKSAWWFLLDRFFSANGSHIGAAYITPLKTISSLDEQRALRDKLTVEGAEKWMHISGWSYTLADLIEWSKFKLKELSLVMVIFNIVLLAFLYRRLAPLLILMVSLALSVGAMVACLKFFSIPLNLFNVLAFPLVLGVGVDYGIYILLAVRQPGDKELAFTTIIKPVLLAGLTAIAGFGSLGFAHNPSLSGLGIVCALGISWCLFATIFFIMPAYVWQSGK